MYYAELCKMQVPAVTKIKASINYWRFMFCSGAFRKTNKLYGGIILFLPIAYIMYLNDKRKI